MSAVVNILALAVPIFVLQVYDRVVFYAGISTLQGLVIGMVIVLIADFALRQSRARILQTVATRADVLIGRRLFDKLMVLPLATLERRPTATWQALFRDIDTVRGTISGTSAVLIADLPFVVLFLALVFVIATPVAWVLVVVVPIFLLLAWRSGRTVSDANQAERQAVVGRDRLLAELIAGRTTVKALALAQAMRPSWEQRHAETIARSLKRGGVADGYAAMASSLTMATTVALTAVGALAIIQQEMTIGALIAANILGGRLLGPLTQLVSMWRTYANFADASARLGEVFALDEERSRDTIELERPKGTVTLQDVDFAYDAGAPPVIKGVNYSFGAPGVYALVGANGSGKTTLIKLMQGLYPPGHGRVLLDDADMAQFSRTRLSTWIGYVPQECVLFSGTIRDNIAHRHPDADDDQIVTAAVAAGAHSGIADLPDGYSTDVGEMGGMLSAGQRQRIAIARALLGDPPVLLLDEPSSNLDREAESSLCQNLTRLGRDHLVVVISHSPVVLSACHGVVVLNAGRIAAAGRPADILGQGGPARATAMPVSDREPVDLDGGKRSATGGRGSTGSAVITLSTATPAEDLARPGPGASGGGPSEGTGS